MSVPYACMSTQTLARRKVSADNDIDMEAFGAVNMVKGGSAPAAAGRANGAGVKPARQKAGKGRGTSVDAAVLAKVQQRHDCCTEGEGGRGKGKLDNEGTLDNYHAWARLDRGRTYRYICCAEMMNLGMTLFKVYSHACALCLLVYRLQGGAGLPSQGA